MTTAAQRHKQRMDALARANDVRLRRALLKRSLSRASRRAALIATQAIVVQPPEHAEAMTLYSLLRACRGIGDTSATLLLREAGISPGRRLRALTGRERSVVVGLLQRIEQRVWSRASTDHAREARRGSQA